eukprot:jgi/Botrbrau1/16661/Bobra.0068s0077.1
MALLIDRLVEDSTPSVEENGNVNGKAFHHKRSQEAQPTFGLKKGRAAFADITNIHRGDTLTQRPKYGVTEPSFFKQPAACVPGHASVIQNAHDCTSAAPIFLGSSTEERDTDARAKFVERTAHLFSGLHARTDYATATPSSCGVSSALLLSEQASSVDIDAEDVNDPLACPAYAEQIMHNLLSSEGKRRPLNYLRNFQTEITAAMRTILVDWLVDVGLEYKIHSETLFLTVAYIDRFLSVQLCPRSKLQLLGVTCMLLAAKHEEIYAPLVADFCHVTDNTYTREEVLQMERLVLDALGWELTQPTILSFLRRFVKAATYGLEAAVCKRLQPLAQYLAELTLTEYSCLMWLPSDIAASAVILARLTLGLRPWTEALEHVTKKSMAELGPCLECMHGLHVHAWAHVDPREGHPGAIRAKYSTSEHRSVSVKISPIPRECLSHFI